MTAGSQAGKRKNQGALDYTPHIGGAQGGLIRRQLQSAGITGC
jgi:hypothetical protein